MAGPALEPGRGSADRDPAADRPDPGRQRGAGRRRWRREAGDVQRPQLLPDHGQRVRRQRPRHLQLLHRPPGQPDHGELLQPQRPSWGGQHRQPRSASATRSSPRSTPLDADVVSLEELENSVQFGKDRDFAINELVTALNAAAGAGTWAAVPSPAPADLPPLAEQDVIRDGFIYKPARVQLVGDSVVLADQSTGTEPFADAREPLAQAFKGVGQPDDRAFAVIVNHFKSKGSGHAGRTDGQGNANDRRVLAGQRAGHLRPRVPGTCAGSTRSSWSATSTPTPRRTRSRPSRPRATPTSSPRRPRREELQLRRSDPARWTTSWPTPRRAVGHGRRHLGRSTPTSRSTTSTAGSTTTSPTSTRRTRSASSDHNPEIVGFSTRRSRRTP